MSKMKAAELETIARGAFEAWIRDACKDVASSTGDTMHFFLSPVPESEEGPRVNVSADFPESKQNSIYIRMDWELNDHAKAAGIEPGELKDRAKEK